MGKGKREREKKQAGKPQKLLQSQGHIKMACRCRKLMLILIWPKKNHQNTSNKIGLNIFDDVGDECYWRILAYC